MATMEKVWQNDMSRVNGGAATVTAKMAFRLWYIKAFLTGTLPSGNPALGLWTMEYSCDSVTAGAAGDHVDRWADASKVVMGTGAGSIHSWCVLSRVLPNGMTIYLLLAYPGLSNTGVVTAGYGAIIYSKAPFTGGTTTARPVNTADCFPAPTATYGTLPPTVSTAAQKCHGGLATDGSIFWIAFSVDGSGQSESCVIFSQIVNTKPGDLYPFWQFHCYQAAQQPLIAALQNTGTPTSANNMCRNYAGAGPYNTPLLIPSVSGSATICTAQTAVDPADNTWVDWPCWVGFCGASPTATPASVKGRIPDFALAPTAIPQGAIDVPSGTATSMVLGALWFPANAAPGL